MKFLNNTACFAIVLALTVIPLASSAEDSKPSGQIAAPGGPLDASVLDSELYSADPTPAAVPPGCQVAQQYIDLIDSGRYDRVADLYSEDAVVMPPIKSMRAVGRQQIDDFYRNVVGKVKPHMIAVSYAAVPGECFQIEAVNRTIDGKTRYSMVTVDHFMINSAGKITQMAAFSRPSSEVHLPPPH
jgi:hypothetical protein